MVSATPVRAIERAFAARGAAVAPVAALPELCDPALCTGLTIWGGVSKPVYLAPRRGRDFVVIVFKNAADARRIGRFERTHAPQVGAAVHESALLVYLKSSERIAGLETALAASRGTRATSRGC
ncbi:MAG TPA: hypothetical protein VHD91_02410 [Gaiellaceae bacterium]|nr:hypothetical protein [Gaiellaceae bacterium]